jgi:glycosyltransferase involved in cell wall biosynthesis
MFLTEGTGIASYASNLADDRTEWLVDAAPGLRPQGGRPLRYSRAFVARWRPMATIVSGNTRLADDAFRTAQVHFDMFGRLLVLRGQALPDLMHWTSPLPLRLAGVPNLYTILDTIPLDHATSTHPPRFRRMLSAIAASADHVVTLSEAARRDILRWVPNLATRISVVPPAITVVKQPAASVHETLQPLGLTEGGYHLFAGILEPRKNVAALVRAFLASEAPRCLVLAGPEGWRGREELASFADAIAQGRIRWLGYLDRPVLLALMQGARALLFPSLAEGFGLPIIEAMALGTPVLTSRGGATEEAAGNAALLVDPRDGADLRAGIAALDTDAELRAQLSALGELRAAQFGAAQQAAQMNAVYEALLAATSMSSVSAQVI